MPRTRTSWVITPFPHTPSWRAQEHLHLYLPSPPTPAKQLLPFSTCMHYPPILSVPHVLSAFICHRNDIIERYKLWSWYKEPQVFRSTPQRLAASMFSNARLCVNKKKKRVYDHRLWSSISGFPHQPELAIQFTTPCTEYTYQFAILHLSTGDFYFPLST